jgi:hypothetical protein
VNITRVRFEAAEAEEQLVRDDLAEEFRAFVSRHRGAKHWESEIMVQTTAKGFWGSMILTPIKDESYPERTEYDNRLDS